MGYENPPRKEAIVDVDGSVWDAKVEELDSNYKHIIALRGAGSVNGIDKAAADKLLEEEFIPRIRAQRESGPVAVMFDGDPDSPDKPDIGYVMGRLKDEFAEEPETEVAFLTAQKKSWYYPATPGGNLGNANGREYETYVFEDGQFPGDHNRFTQSERLVNADGYEQWYVGASGPIAQEQLHDYDSKVQQERKQKVVMFRAPLNEELAPGFDAKLAEAREKGDEGKIAKFEGAIQQREKQYGVHWDNEGNSTLKTEEFPHLDFEFVTGESRENTTQ